MFAWNWGILRKLMDIYLSFIIYWSLYSLQYYMKSLHYVLAMEKCYLISEGPVKNCLQNILNLFVEYWSRFTNTRTLQGKTIVLYCDFCLPTHACWIFICFVQKLMNMSMSLAPGGLLVNSPWFNQGQKGCRTTEHCILKLYSRKPSIQISSSLLSRQIA